jgi:hypothetical protein
MLNALNIPFFIQNPAILTNESCAYSTYSDVMIQSTKMTIFAIIGMRTTVHIATTGA